MGLSGVRFWEIAGRFIANETEVTEADNRGLAEKRHRASRHWTRHIHANHAIERSAEFETERDNQGRASIAMTSI